MKLLLYAQPKRLQPIARVLFLAMKMKRPLARGSVSLESKNIGEDLVVIIYGGDSPHVGGAAIAYVTKSRYRDDLTTSVSILSFPGHKDYILAQSTAEKLASTLNKSVVVIAGVHINDATHEQIDEVITTVNSMIDDMVSQLQPSREE